MLLFRKPTPEILRTFVQQQQTCELSYAPIGATATVPPANFKLDHTRIRVGAGPEAFAAAKMALRNWQQFNLSWLQAWPADTPIQVGQVVAVVARFGCVWWLNACRIVYVIDEPQRFGFAYGTLPDHAARGEERFLIELDEAGAVWFDILAFSQPVHFLARVGYRMMRRVQKRFARQSAAALQRAVDAVE